jgi:hypothetical protein
VSVTVERVEVRFQLRHRARADDRARHAGPVLHPLERDLRGRRAVSFATSISASMMS